MANILLKDDLKPPRVRFLYWGGVDGVEDEAAGGFLFQANEIDSPWRVLDLTAGSPGTEAIPQFAAPAGVLVADDTGGGGDRFCANVTILPSGQPMTTGGTRWGLEANGTLELFGLPTTSIFDPAANVARLAGSMAIGRWYPSMTPLPSGDVFAGAGIRTLFVFQTHNDTWEVFNRKTLTWSKLRDTDAALNPTNAFDSPRRLLPLFSRLILLPNGSVLYPPAGQLYGPAGRHPLGTTWPISAHIEPEGPNPVWQPVLNASGDPDTTIARSGAQVLLMPLTPPYDTATVVTLSGIEDPKPESLPIPTVITPDNTTEFMSFTFSGGVPRVTRTRSPKTPSLNIARWFATGVLLPDRSVMMIGGGTCDEVVTPGCEMAIFTPERSKNPADPGEPWKLVANQQRPRTYHNTAGIVMLDGRVASAGHRPIPANFADAPDSLTKNHDVNLFANAQIGRDLMWEIYKPGYLFAVERPELGPLPQDKFTYGEAVCLRVKPVGSLATASAQLMRPGAVTHVDQHEQRLVVLETLGTCANGNGIHVKMPPNGAVAPPGFWMLSVLEFGAGPNADWPDVPSEARFIQLCRGRVPDDFGDSCSGIVPGSGIK